MEKFCRFANALRMHKIDIAVVTSPANVTYTTGFDVPYYKSFMETVAKDSPMAVGVITVDDSHRKLFASDFYVHKVKRCPSVEDVTYFRNYDAFEDIEPTGGVVAAIKEYLRKLGADKAVIGIESQTCPANIYSMIRECFPNMKIVDVYPALYEARKIKTAEEILLLREASRVMDIAQNTLIEIADSDGKEELTEFDIWARVQLAINNSTDELLPFVGELVTGAATGLSDYPLGPKRRVIKRGDSGIMDVYPRVNGYWADTCNSVVFYSERNKEQKKYFDAVKAALDAAIEMLVPGKKCSDVEMAARRAFESHGFGAISYIGHEIGVEVNENPRITCYDHTIIEENMVFCLEPQQYTGKDGATGVRLEKMVLVTANGPEVLSKFQMK